MRYRKIVLAIVTLLAIGVAVIWRNRENWLRQSSFSPFSFKPFSLPNLQGQVVAVDATAHELTLLTFWSASCSSCKDDLVFLSEIARQTDPTRLGIYAVSKDYSVDRRETSADLTLLLHKMNIFGKFHVLRDIDDSVATFFDVYAVPETFVITANGQVTRKFVGPISRQREIVWQLIERHGARAGMLASPGLGGNLWDGVQ